MDSCAGGVFRKMTHAKAEELIAKISQNYDDWAMAEPTPAPTPAPTPKKRGMIELNDEVMREAKKSLKRRVLNKKM